MTRTARLAFAAALTIVLAAAGAGLAPSPAGAASQVRYGITDDAWLLDGPGTLESRIARLHSLGVQIVRFTLEWNQIAPTMPATPTDPEDPAYDWSSVDTVLGGLHDSGMNVLLQLNGTPGWANGGLPPNYAPVSRTAFGDFATAAATRYSWVTRWLIWNEPNQARWLRPTKPAVYTTRLLDPAYAAIHRAIPSAQVAGGGTAPRGGSGGVSPVAWVAGMHAAHARLDAYAHNPYPLDPKRETPFHDSCTGCTTITMASLGRLVTRVVRYWPSARIWLTEYGYQTNPPDRLLGVSKSLQARYLSDGAYVAFRTPRVDLLIHFLYRDEPELARFQSGLVTLGDRTKPALSAFRLPLAETARRGTITFLWGQLRAPGTGGVAQIERRVRGAWRVVATVRAGAGRFFRWRGTLARRSVVRLRAGTLVGAPLIIT